MNRSALYVAATAESAPVSHTWMAAIGLGVAALSFAMLSLPYFSGNPARFVEVSPRGILIEQRNGARINLAWSSVRGYVYNGTSHIFLVQGGSVELKMPGLPREQKALLRVAVRTPLEAGSMKWRSRQSACAPRGERMSLLAIIAFCTVGGLLIHQGERAAAGLVLALGTVYLIITLIKSARRNKGP